MTGGYPDGTIEQMPRNQLRALQSERLQSIVRWAYDRSLFYKQRFDEYGVDPRSIQSVDDLTDLPFTVKGDFREHYPLGMLAAPREQLARVQASSGTRGKLTVVAYTKRDVETWAEVCARSLALAGARPGDTVQNAYGYGLFTGGLGLHYGAERLGATVIPMSGGNTLRQVTLLRDLGAQVLCCTPSYALIIAEVLEREGITTDELALRVGVFGAEPWSEAIRLEVEERLGIHAVDIYGLSEVIGPGVACECVEARDGLHLMEDHFLAEVVNPATGEPAPDGEFGELVLTTLTKEAMPVIRYRTGDISAIVDEPCSCGRTHRRMARLRGRIDDMIVLHGVNVYPSEVEATLLGFDEIAPFYQIVLDRDSGRETVEVQAEITPQYSEAAIDADMQILAAQITRLLKSRFDLTMRVRLLQPGELGRIEAGKAIRVVDRRTG
ncbi:MAG TPA: phenylacetate--CoA ligase [Thermomicrobiales bacterium]|nr:phenylacetate--CoA ligase [Thermomicrobiales bacterium]